MIAVIDYNAGNTRSVLNALHRLGAEGILTSDPEQIRSADRVIFPGVGEAGSAMRHLADREMDTLICSLVQPVLGICLGLQLMCSYSEEGDTKCLGIFKEKVLMFPPKDIVPHMGWNNFSEVKGPLFEHVSAGDNVYYVHSYYAETGPDTVASCDYILPFSAAMQRNNFYAVQFHPEKSAATGERILHNFLEL
jgi:imidazole glycerol-phosphate synthase subunit HisH